ncbi:MAG: cytochrome c biogenesis protein CcsA [Candidatus Cryptobacteroides sp.]
MIWDNFIYFAAVSVALSFAGAFFSAARRQGRSVPAICLSVASALVLGSFIVLLWIALRRPPLRTMGETRLWYSFFACLAGIFTYCRWRYRWILPFSAVLSTVFVVINCLKPEIHDASLMPALQSPWFIPHVTVYMFSYSVFGCAFLLAVAGLLRKGDSLRDKEIFGSMDTLIYIGLAFLTLGMMSGSLWAKDAWGHYWNWDPKETWAALTWLSYLLYVHLRIFGKVSRRTLCGIVIFSFLCLQMCWWGVNLLPAAQDSIHVYNR